MRIGLSISSVGHGALLAWAMLGLPGASSHVLDRQQPLPIDVVSMEEYTRITAGVRDGEEEKPTAAPQPPKEAPPAERVSEAPPAREQSAAPEPAPPPPPPQAQPEPAPEPAPVPADLRTAAIPPEPAPSAEPAPKPPIRADAPLPRARPDIAPPPRQAERPEPPRERERERPRDPEPRQPAQQRPDHSFDPDRIAALLNRVPDAGGALRSDAPSERETVGRGLPSGSDDRLSISDIDALRRQIAQCWNPPIGVREAEELVVRVSLELNPDGSLSAPPRVLGGSFHPVFNIAAEAATRAVSRCEPYRLPPEKYHLWREIHVNFDPREMLGG